MWSIKKSLIERSDALTQDERDEYEERAAHMEYDANMTRKEAENGAWWALVFRGARRKMDVIPK